MSETYFAGAYWGARKETAEECARRAEAFFSTLREVDSSFSNWFQQGKSRKDALKRPIEPSRTSLEEIVRRGRDRVFEDLGFRFSAWNGAHDDHDGSSFNVTCGGFTDVVCNSCVFDLPSQGPNAERVLTSKVVSHLVRSMAIAWEPDSAVGMSSSHLQMVDKGIPFAVLPGWVTYLAQHRGTVPPLPAPVRVESVGDKGTLIVLTPERFTVSNPEHVALAERVHDLLDRAEMLKPLQAQP
ncbi:immunity 52 family protein [Corallococcus terminator]